MNSVEEINVVVCLQLRFGYTAAAVNNCTMATAKSVASDLGTCSICLEVFDNPKSLPCLHAFCLKCLQRAFENMCPGDEVSCPLCRTEFQIPTDVLQELFIVQRPDDVYEEFCHVPCVVCLEEGDGRSEETATATVYCVNCQQKLCDSCSRPHKRMPGGAHQLQTLRTEMEQELIQLWGNACDKHKDKPVELYCQRCNKNICVLCFAYEHRDHDFDQIPAVAENFKVKFVAVDEQILSAIANARQLSKQLKESSDKFFSDVYNAEKMIFETGDEIKRIVDSQVAELVSKLQSVKSNSAKQAQAIQDSLQMALAAMESFHRSSRELLDKGRPSDVTRAACGLLDTAAKLLRNDDVTTHNFRPPQVIFTPADVTQMSRLNLIGKVTVDSGNQSGTRYPLRICTLLL